MPNQDWFANEKAICRAMGERKAPPEEMRAKLVDLLFDKRLLDHWAWDYPDNHESHRYLATWIFENARYGPNRFKRLIGVESQMLDKAVAAMFPDIPAYDITPEHVGAVLRRIEIEEPGASPYTGDNAAT